MSCVFQIGGIESADGCHYAQSSEDNRTGTRTALFLEIRCRLPPSSKSHLHIILRIPLQSNTRVQLYSDKDHSTPIATHSAPYPTNPTLKLLSHELEATAVIDSMIMSFLILEQRMRIMETGGEVAQGMGKMEGNVGFVGTVGDNGKLVR